MHERLFSDINWSPTSLIPEITVDRPFIYLILTADSYEPILMGHFVNPNKADTMAKEKTLFNVAYEDLK